MQEQAKKLGAVMVINTKLETATLGRSANRKGSVGSVEVIAYSTGLILNK